MRLSTHVLAASLAYLLAGVLLASGVLPPLAAAVLAAPFALLIPAGVGLVACFGWRGAISPGIGRVQALLVAWLYGTLATIYVFVLLERLGLTGKLADPVLAAFFVLGAAGWLRLRGHFATQRTDWSTLRLVALVSIPLVIAKYITEIYLYSDYPILDLFQRIHFHKGALEFANFGVLNPFVADSYVPLQQLLLGLLARGAHVDPLLAEWVLPIVMAPLKVCAIYCVASRLTRSNTQLGLAIGLFLAMSSVTNLTNGDVASLAALLFMSFLLGPAEEDKAWREKVVGMLFLLAAIAGALFVVRLPAPTGLTVLLGAGLLASAPALSANAARTVVIAIVIFTTISFHRSAILFLVLVVAIQFAVAFYLRMYRRGDFRSVAIISLVQLTLVVGMAGRILSYDGQHLVDEFGLWGLYDFVLGPLAGKSMTLVSVDHDLSQGSGGRIGLFEMARSLSFVVTVFGGLLFLSEIRRAIGARDAKVGEGSAAKLGVALSMTSLLLLGAALTGFPFIHRMAFLIATLLSVAMAVFVDLSISEARSAGHRAIAGSIGLVGYMGGVLGFLLLVHNPTIEPFLEVVFPFLFLLLAAGVAIAAWCIRGRRSISLAPLLVVAVLFEGIASRAYFKQYSFMSKAPPKDTVFTSFGQRELATADTIVGQLSPGSVLVSDPKTMALIGARSGLSPFVSFSNLNTMTDSTRNILSGLLGSVALGAPRWKLCSELQRISSSFASSQLNYSSLMLGQGLSGGEALKLLGFNDALVPHSVASVTAVQEKITAYAHQAADSTINKVQPFTIVISSDTLDWLDHPYDPMYFPAQRDVSEIADVLRSYGSSVRRVGDAFLLLVSCE